jgi:hypothetical protein
VTIKVFNYPKKNIYAVNVYQPGNPTKNVLGWIKTTKQSGTVQHTYQLPKNLRNLNRMTFCLKNLVFDNTQCNSYVKTNKDSNFTLRFTWSVIYTTAY